MAGQVVASVKRGKALVASLRAQPGVRDPEALAAYLGRFKKARKAGNSVAKARAAAGGNGDSKADAKPKAKKRTLEPDDITYGKPTTSAGTQEIDVKADVGAGYPQAIAKLKRRKGEKEWQIEYGDKTFRQPASQGLAEIKRKLKDKISKDSKSDDGIPQRHSRSSGSTANPVKNTARGSGSGKKRAPRSISDDELPLVIQFAKNAGENDYLQKLRAEQQRRKKKK